MLERSNRSHSAICAGDAKEDISVSGTGSCGFESRSAYHRAPLAQLVEHLTLNQGGMGSSPIRRTLCTGDGTGILARLRTGYLRVRVPPCVPSYAFSSVGRALDF